MGSSKQTHILFVFITLQSNYKMQTWSLQLPTAQLGKMIITTLVLQLGKP